MKGGKGKGRKRAIDENRNIRDMKDDRSPAVDAKTEEDTAVWRKRCKTKNRNDDDHDELYQEGGNKDVEKKVEERKGNLNTVKDQRGYGQVREAADLTSSGTESDEPDQDDGNYNKHRSLMHCFARLLL